MDSIWSFWINLYILHSDSRLHLYFTFHIPSINENFQLSSSLNLSSILNPLSAIEIFFALSLPSILLWEEHPQSFLFPMQHSRYIPTPISCKISLSPPISGKSYSSYVLTEAAEVNRALFTYRMCSIFFQSWMYFNFSVQKGSGTILLSSFSPA